MIALSAKNITKSYGDDQALRGVDLTVESGEIFGIIGPDGAGKTTLFRILTTLLLPDVGSASILGHDVIKEYKQIRQKVGYMPGRFSLYQDLSVEENLKVFATIFRTTIQENYHLIQDIYQQIEPFKTRKAGALSGGMKQKLALCCALIHKPEILFLDEPTTGVDPVSRREFWDMLIKLRDQGITMLVSTPYMDEAKRCDRIALIQGGSFLQIDSPDSIIQQFPHPIFSIEGEHLYDILKVLRVKENVHSCYAFGDSLHVTFDSSVENDGPDLNLTLKQEGFSDLQVKKITAGIEDCFMELTQ